MKALKDRLAKMGDDERKAWHIEQKSKALASGRHKKRDWAEASASTTQTHPTAQQSKEGDHFETFEQWAVPQMLLGRYKTELATMP
eukprot:6856949-Pyramimonas_sp.AAC.1